MNHTQCQAPQHSGERDGKGSAAPGEDFLLGAAEGKERNRPAHSRMTVGAASTRQGQTEEGTRHDREGCYFRPSGSRKGPLQRDI